MPRDTSRPCWTCTHFHGEVRFGGYILCHQNRITLHFGADTGCAFWRREPGADDEILLLADRNLAWNEDVYPDPPELIARRAAAAKNKRY